MIEWFIFIAIFVVSIITLLIATVGWIRSDDKFANVLDDKEYWKERALVAENENRRLEAKVNFYRNELENKE